MKKQAVIILSSIALLTSACTEPGRTTGYAAAAGGALGAGLGAIVGSQVGSAGAGLAIGAAAGAGAGAAIGNALEANDKKMAAHDERLNRQDELIRAQRNEIASLRNVDRDTYPAASTGNGSTRGGVRGVAASNFADRSTGKGATALDTGGVRYASASEIAAAKSRAEGMANAQSSRAQLSSNYIKTASASTTTASVKPSLPVSETRRGDTAKTDDSVSEKNLIDTPTSAISATGHESMVNSKIDKAPTTTSDDASDTTTATVNTTSKTTECSNGEEEVAKADQASDSADKQFHLRRALRLCPTSAKYHVTLSDLYLTLNRRDDAIFEAKEALRLDPNDSVAAGKLTSLQKSPSLGVQGSIAAAKEPKLPSTGRY